MYLPILTARLAGAGLLAGSVTVAIAAAAITVILIIALPFGGLVEKLVASPSEEVLLLKVLGLTVLEARVIVIAGLAVAAGAHPRLGPLAAACVLILAVLGPAAARGVEPLSGWMRARRQRRPGRRAAPAHGMPATPAGGSTDQPGPSGA